MKIKKIDAYIIRQFITLFVMTFILCTFVFLMQFLWKSFDELVGKGVGVGIIAEFFLYATANVMPMALPLAIMLASLMTFGNLGENVELTAMKSAGISLFRIMRPLVVFLIFVCGAAFYFSNNVLPVSNKKLYALVFSLKHKSPELDIPAGEFYTGINGYNLYVRQKTKGLLRDLMIYDYSSGFNNATVMLADSGRIHFTADKKYLLLTLYEGESFENLKKQNTNATGQNTIPYRRETFEKKEILLDFDSDFERYDESLMTDQHISKNIVQLTRSIDSARLVVRARAAEQSADLVGGTYFGKTRLQSIKQDTINATNTIHYSTDSLLLSLNYETMGRAVSSAVVKANEMKNKINYNTIMLDEPQKYMKRHQIEWQRKLTLSFACLIFFFIGAPLGAIIRKGGLGMPVVISVLMFITYYIIDNAGYKMAREVWTAFEGMWLSSAVLLPIGIFLTYKAAVDATLFNTEYYVALWGNVKKVFEKKKKS
ncbi:MAG: LptF/LptG family permease [Paludibacter sp.]|nr:LptF/LptG family permease [Paludibacter sp.]